MSKKSRRMKRMLENAQKVTKQMNKKRFRPRWLHEGHYRPFKMVSRNKKRLRRPQYA